MDTVELMKKVDHELWDIVERNVSEQDDMSKIAAVMMKVAVQMYKMTYTEDVVLNIVKHAIDNLDIVRVPGRVPGPPSATSATSETLH